MPGLPEPTDSRWLLKTVLSRPRLTVPAAACIAIGFVCNGLIPVLVGRAIDRGIATGDARVVLGYGAAIGLTYLTNVSLTWFGRTWTQKAILTAGHDIRMAVTDRIHHPRGLAGQRRTAGELLSIASTDTNRVASAVFMTVLPVAELTAIIYASAMTMTMHVPLGIGVLIGGPITVIIALRAAAPLRRASSRRQRALADASSMATDVVKGLRILKGLGAIVTVRSRYQYASHSAYQATVGANAAQARLNAVTEIVGSLYIILIALAAALLAVHGQLTLGELVTAIGLTQFIIHPMTMFGRNLASRWAPAQASAERVTDVLAADYRLPEESTPIPQLPPGLTVVPEVPTELLTAPRERVLVVPHTADLFDGTVAENIHPDRPTARRALHVAAAADIPGGLDKQVGESGSLLSGGQRQRVALARAVAADADILVLTDPTTAVDSVTEQRIVDNIVRHRGARPTVVVTSSPAWLAAGGRHE
ncbi:ABC transporter transmembrane domain-containing protein [Corynebacterium uterequi]|uniref:ABC-type multidrug transport system, ATPase and permease component n=1 Tax=Corynebacterium uterequi TaxID=1072256 RepID=A0A0G3HCD5_9CORY|nr:ABC transporter ATP-binding protein [Corynebacterium uterequi]AKK11046.1 ABC-type multidrug transport system, ATPase and permease component [Corynebacterium uterequi]